MHLSTHLVIGPAVDLITICPALSCSLGITMPLELSLPGVGLNPTIPVKCAGRRIEPPISLPNPNGVQPLATKAASPPLLPPGVRDMFHGLFVQPQI